MSLDVEGFTEVINGGVVSITVNDNHRLLKLANNLPWEDMLNAILPDLKRTQKKCWWMGRPLRVRIHLGVYVLQQMFNLADRVAEQQLQDNAAFRLFCGYHLLKKWHVPDHTKIEAFRSRLTAETQRTLANLISQHAVKLGFANSAQMDVDSTVQEANITYPSMANLLIKVAGLAAKVAKGLNKFCHDGQEVYRIGLKNLKQIALYYFNLKRKGTAKDMLKTVQQRLWRETYDSVLPILNNMQKLTNKIKAGKYWPLRRAVETLSWRGVLFLENIHSQLFEGVIKTKISSLHAYEVACFNKGKRVLSKSEGIANISLSKYSAVIHTFPRSNWLMMASKNFR